MRAGLTWLLPGMLDRRMAASMGMMPVVAAESPVASARIERFIRSLNCRLPRIVTIPHPVADEYMRIDQHVTRENRIICVGRWQTYQKNFPLLSKVLAHFLAEHPSWSADVVGLPPDRPQSIGEAAALVHKRLHFHGRVPHQDISRLYQKSKIFLMSSRFESFNIAAAEALCCGCSVVGASDVASVPFFTSQASGTGACRLSKAHLLDALNAEVEAWNSGQRNPEQISTVWRARVGAAAISKLVLRELEAIAPATP
jgi:glycosyltransferase involved in cell wall biosynthesis